MSASEHVKNFSGVEACTVEFVQQCPARFKCTACGVIHGALKTARCGHSFCPACSQPTEVNPSAVKFCPADGGKLLANQFVSDAGVSDVLKLDVFCTSRRKGCQKTLPLRGLQGHRRSCGFVEVPCPYDCGLQVCRRSIAEHLTKNCDLRLLSCQHCHEEVPFREKQEHLESCGKRPVVCPFCKKHLVKQQMNEHEANCTERPRPCPLAQIGCQVKGDEANLKQHADDVTPHFRIVVKAILSNQVTIQKALEKMDSLSNQVMQLKNDVKNLAGKMDQESRKVPKILINHVDSGRSSPATSDTSKGTKYSAPPTSL